MTFASASWRATGVALTVVFLVGLRLATAAAIRAPSKARASVRLSWSARPQRIETCRRLTDEELAQRPAHMRLRMECSGAFARYLLTVEMDGRAIATDTVRGGGLRNDRPMHVFEEFDTSPGSHQLRVSLVRIEATQDSSGTTRDSTVATAGTLLGERESRERDERQRRAGEAIPASLVLDTVVNLGPGGVVLVTYDGQVDRLVALTGKQP